MFTRETAMRMSLDFDFNVYLYLMLTFAVLLLVVMVCQLATTHNRLTQIRDLLEQRIPNPNSRKPKAYATATEASAPDEKQESAEENFYRGQIVLLLKDESQMKIADVLGDGTYVCYMNGVKAGTFRKDEITDFSAYWKQKNAPNQ